MKNKFEYDIKLTESEKIDLSITSDNNNIIDKYVLLKIIHDLLVDSNQTNKYENINQTIKTLNFLLKNVEKYVVERLKILKDCDLKVKTKDDLFNLKYDFFYEDKKMKRVEGLKVFVESENNVYQLVDGVDNKNWKILE